MPNLVASTTVDNFMQAANQSDARLAIGAASTQQIQSLQAELGTKLPVANAQMTGTPSVNGKSILTDSSPVIGGTW
jgi:hypothetical protein